MYPHICHVFIDGGYLRARADNWQMEALDPRKLADGLIESSQVQTWAYDRTRTHNALLGRVTYYDALPGEEEEAELSEYWDAIELLHDVHLGFGALKGLRRKVRQKGVDTLVAVDMVVGAFSGLFDIAVLVAGDADFTPVVEEVRRRGVMVAVAAASESYSEELKRAADRFIEISERSSWLEPVRVKGKTFSAVPKRGG